ncbi:MAG: AI-2E family transporter [Gammaproteobacteria bacterium]|nr:MAG: AI-2E family transporter [Gammaproteobacteria bacterium]
MRRLLTRWYRRYFSDPEAVILALLLALGFAVVLLFGEMLAPVLASIVIAYLLEGLVGALERRKVPRPVAVGVVYTAFLGILGLLLFGLLPLLSAQLQEFARDLPTMVAKGQQALLRLPELYPGLITEEEVRQIMAGLRTGLTGMAQSLLSASLTTLTGLITVLVYLVLVPVLVFFFLKDKEQILGWVTALLPSERRLATQVWREMDQQIGNYVRGKFAEIFIVGAVSYVVFALLGLRYASLLAALVGLSVIVPFVGAVVVTVPVVLVAFFQWGWSEQFGYAVGAYAVIQALDGNVLVPLLFSEAVNLHPVAIIIAVLLFGGLWGFWGVFFAIPLATLVKAVLHAWPRCDEGRD